MAVPMFQKNFRRGQIFLYYNSKAYLKRKWSSQELLQPLYTSEATSRAPQTILNMFWDSPNLFVVPLEEEKKEQGNVRKGENAG